MYGILEKRNCDTQCDNQCWVKDKTFRIKDGSKQIGTAQSPEEFWAFFIEEINRTGRHPFDAFRYWGCWNWLLDDSDVGYYEELGKRLETAESLKIPALPANSFDDCPSNLLDDLLTLKSELTKAQAKRQKDNQGK